MILSLMRCCTPNGIAAVDCVGWIMCQWLSYWTIKFCHGAIDFRPAEAV